MPKTGITEFIGYGQMVAVWVMGFATWYFASDLASVTGKLEVLKVMASLAGVGTTVVAGRKAYTEVRKHLNKDDEADYQEGTL